MTSRQKSSSPEAIGYITILTCYVPVDRSNRKAESRVPADDYIIDLVQLDILNVCCLCARG